MAQDYAEMCIWAHGQPERDPADMPYNPVGQNMFLTGGTLNVVNAIGGWYNEIRFFDYDTLACDSGKMCGHYTQVGTGI